MSVYDDQEARHIDSPPGYRPARAQGPGPVPCRSCGAPMIWATTAKNGKAIPLDAEPAPDGNIELVDGKACVVDASTPNLFGVPRYKSHFATCPHAKHHRKDTKR